MLSKAREIPDRPCCLRRILRSRRRIQPSSGANVERWLCLKYSNQPRSVELRSAMIWDRLRPAVRLVLARTVSLRFDPRPFLVRRHRLTGLSGARSPLGHCLRAQSAGGGHYVSIFLHPLAPPALPGFIATMSAVTPAWGAWPCSFLCPLAAHAGLLASRIPPSEPSV